MNSKTNFYEPFIAQITIVNHPTKIKAGYITAVHCHNCLVPCSFSKLISIVDRQTGEVIEENPD